MLMLRLILRSTSVRYVCILQLYISRDHTCVSTHIYVCLCYASFCTQPQSGTYAFYNCIYHVTTRVLVLIYMYAYATPHFVLNLSQVRVHFTTIYVHIAFYNYICTYLQLYIYMYNYVHAQCFINLSI